MQKSLKYHRSFAKINLSAIRENFVALKNCIPEGTKTMAIVKANAYGHGAVRVAKVLENMADYFAVADIQEALELRENGIKNPILILSYTSSYHYEELIANSIISTIYSLEDARKLSQLAVEMNKKALVHIAVDTGMNRIGLKDTDESADIIKRISGLSNIVIDGVFTHFASADCRDKSFMHIQQKRFADFLEKLESRGVNIPLKHCCNSAAIIDSDCHYDMVRMGIALYGLYPSDEVMSERVALKPAMEVISRIIHIKDVEAGEGIGYGHAYVTPEKRRIATVCIGYADGYSRAFSNNGFVLVDGKRAPVVGRVCMDQIMIDITGIENACVGDQVVIMGEDKGGRITAEELGEMCGSFNYEMICTFMPRVNKVYYENGELV